MTECAECQRLRKRLQDADEREAILIAGIDNLAKDRRKIVKALYQERYGKEKAHGDKGRAQDKPPRKARKAK